MKAKMKDNLIMRYQTSSDLIYPAHDGCYERNELLAVKKVHGWAEYFKLKLFLKGIEGKSVELVFTAGDAFEKKDNNVWLPSDLWDAT